MTSSTPRLLLADTPQAVPLVARLLGDEFTVIPATTCEEALRSLQADEPDVAIIGYHFDDQRPYRLLQSIRDAGDAARMGVILVRALPVLPHRRDESEIEESYRQLGVDAYLVLDKTARGEDFDAVSKRLRTTVWRLCAQRVGASSAGGEVHR